MAQQVEVLAAKLNPQSPQSGKGDWTPRGLSCNLHVHTAAQHT